MTEAGSGEIRKQTEVHLAEGSEAHDPRMLRDFHKLNLMLFIRRVSACIHLDIQNQIQQGRI